MNKKYVILVIALFFVVPCIVSIAADKIFESVEISKKESIKEKQKRHDLICIDLRKNGPVIPVKKGPRLWIGNKIDWTLDNLVRSDGWQLTGWSKLKFDEEFNASRWKFGIISPEMIAARMDGDVDPCHETRWERYQKSVDAITVGVSWSREF